jgi:hypothetical protein
MVTLAGATASAPDAGAGVVPLSRLSTVRVQGVAESDTFDVSRGSEQFGGYQDGLSDEAIDPNGTTARASASQSSVVDASRVDLLRGSATGAADVFATFSPDDNSGPLMVGGTSALAVRFEVTGRAEPFRVSGVFGGSFGSASVSLVESSDPANLRFVFSARNDDPLGFEFDEEGDLQPGIYTLSARAFAGSSGGSGTESNFSTFDARFSIGTAVTPIPLPPAYLTGTMGLIASAAAARRMRKTP